MYRLANVQNLSQNTPWERVTIIYNKHRQSTTRQKDKISLIFYTILLRQDEKTSPYTPTCDRKDTRVTRLDAYGGMLLVETFNIIPPLVDDPYVMGKIAYAVVLGGIHSLGVAQCPSIRIILGISDVMKDDERKTVVPMTIRGFVDAAKAAETSVKDCQVFQNPWCLFGGTATTLCYPHEIVEPVDATAGDVIVLTKPLGTMVALTVSEWMKQPEKKSRLILAITEESVERARSRAVDCMMRTNQIAAALMRKVGFYQISGVDCSSEQFSEHSENHAKFGSKVGIHIYRVI